MFCHCRAHGFPTIMRNMVVSGKNGRNINELRDTIFEVACHVRENTVAGRGVGCGRIPEYRLLMDQLVPASYLQLEDSIRNIAINLRLMGKPPVLTYKEFRFALGSERVGHAYSWNWCCHGYAMVTAWIHNDVAMVTPWIHYVCVHVLVYLVIRWSFVNMSFSLLIGEWFLVMLTLWYSILKDIGCCHGYAMVTQCTCTCVPANTIYMWVKIFTVKKFVKTSKIAWMFIIVIKILWSSVVNPWKLRTVHNFCNKKF